MYEDKETQKQSPTVKTEQKVDNQQVESMNPEHSFAVAQCNGYNTNIMDMGRGGKKSHYKKNPSDSTTNGPKTRRQKKTLDRHLARLRAGEGEVVDEVDGGAGKIKVVKLPSTKEGNTPHIYGIKHPGGDGRSAWHPRTPEGGGEYDSDSDEEED